MISLSFFGHSWLVICAPTYPKPKKSKSYRPRLACPPMDRDLLEEARTLYKLHHLTAAAMTCRCAIEREVTKLAMSREDFGDYWIGLAATADWLRLNLVIRQRTHAAVIRAAEIGNTAAHSGTVSREDVQQMFVAVDCLRHTVRRKVGKRGVA
jgi:hypothetical protein